MERDGHTVMLALPSPAGYQRNHAWLLSSGDEHLHTTLDQMKIKLLSIDRNQKLQIKLHFSGEACKHLFSVEESSSKNKPIKWSKPITYQHFWGTPFVATAFRDSQDKETELVARLDVVQMKSKRDAEKSALEQRQNTVLQARQDDVCSAICSASALPATSPLKATMDHAVMEAQQVLQVAHAHAAEAQEKLDNLWLGRLRRRGEFDAQRAAKRKSAHEAVESGKTRKKDNLEAVEGMGASALARATRFGASASPNTPAPAPAPAATPQPDAVAGTSSDGPAINTPAPASAAVAAAMTHNNLFAEVMMFSNSS